MNSVAKFEDISQARPALEKLIGYLKNRGMDVGHADRFFAVSEFEISFEELYYGLREDGIALPGDYQDLFNALKSYFERLGHPKWLDE